ncbi:hypothetical protein Hypma_016002 [Hypsizygus marmoreus]|uniref:O-methylsterigmatocystin oxidoreductase n=1 Tax=Hypsizygus marmoreus TaxID=39966 RepID=A0A369K9Q9_HYPMA|nr:hypothetical protein Hypma_016002 [Hypsizygus marmoreus]
MPVKKPWITYTRWAKRYGGIVHLRDYSQHVVLVNTREDAIALFEKRSHVYSDRPSLPMLELMGWDFNTGLMPYGDRWRRHRRLFHQNFRKDAALAFQPTQTQKTHEFLVNMLSSPDNYAMHTRTIAAAIVMSTIYDHEIAPTNDRFVTAAEQAVTKLSEAFFPGAAAVNALPILRHLPAWFPGAGFQRFAKGCKVYTNEMREVPFNFVKENMASGVPTQALAAKLLARNDALGGSAVGEDDIKGVAATAFAAGADTTVSALGSFFYAMLCNPRAQKRGQEEIDAVIGKHRLPQYGDRSSLPYVEAIYREIMRWRPVTPLGVAHSTSEDDIYNGYFIPKGTVVLANIWAMTRDEERYPQPDLFLPERFLDADGNLNDDSTVLTFGFGRRICVGRHMASATVWLMIANVLATFDIAKAKDENGVEIPVNDDYSDGLICHKLPYRCSVTVRSEEAQRLINLHAAGNDINC